MCIEPPPTPKKFVTHPHFDSVGRRVFAVGFFFPARGVRPNRQPVPLSSWIWLELVPSTDDLQGWPCLAEAKGRNPSLFASWDAIQPQKFWAVS